MDGKYAEQVQEMERRILSAPGALDPQVRDAAMRGTPLEDPLAEAYVEKVRLHAYKITDQEMDDLRAAGWSEEQIFELTVSAAYGAGKRRLDAGLRGLATAVGRLHEPATEGAD
jgi:alkylhydroperoxidase family enzyme